MKRSSSREGRGRGLCPLGAQRLGPNESTVAGKLHPLTCPLNPTPIRRLAFPAGDRKTKKAAKKLPQPGEIHTFTQEVEYQMRYSESRSFWALAILRSHPDLMLSIDCNWAGSERFRHLAQPQAPPHYRVRQTRNLLSFPVRRRTAGARSSALCATVSSPIWIARNVRLADRRLRPAP